MFLKESEWNRLSIDYCIPSPRRFDFGVGAVGRLVYKGIGKAVISYRGKNDRFCYKLAQLGRWKGGKCRVKCRPGLCVKTFLNRKKRTARRTDVFERRTSTGSGLFA